MDTYVEWLIERKNGAFDNLIRIGGYALTALFMFGGIFLNPLLFLPAVMLGVCCYFLFPMLNVEYEYLYLDRSITIDKIFSREKRKKADEFDLNKMEIYAEEGAPQLDQYKNLNARILDYSSRYPDRKRFIMVIRDEDSVKKVILEPDEKITEAIKILYPSKVFFK